MAAESIGECIGICKMMPDKTLFFAGADIVFAIIDEQGSSRFQAKTLQG